MTPETDPKLFAWRDKFNAVCAEFGVKPAAVRSPPLSLSLFGSTAPPPHSLLMRQPARQVCVQFSFLFPEIKSIALATSKKERVASNIELADAVMPPGLWDKLQADGLIDLSDPK